MRKKYLRRSPVLQKIGDEPEQFTEEQVAEPSPPTLDPASIAARLLLDRALADCGLSLVQAAQNGVVTVVVVPSPEWTAVVLDDWTTRARADKPYKELFGQIWKGEWLYWAPGEMPRLGRIEEDAGKFARAIAAGRHCVGITPDETWLPGDFVDAADHHLVLGQLREEDIAVIAEELCGDVATLLPPDIFTALISPKHLRLARRVGQSADAYVDKLLGLIKKLRRQTNTITVSPRGAPTLDRLHGMDEAVQWGLAVARDLQAYREGKLPWSAVDSGCLLAGPPGCGKTLFARAFAATCGVELISGSYGIWHASGSAHQGHFLQAMRKAFSDARAKAPAVFYRRDRQLSKSCDAET